MRQIWQCLLIVVLLSTARVAGAQTEPAPSEPWSPPATSADPHDEELPAPDAARQLGAEVSVVPDELLTDEDPSWYMPRYWLDPLPWDTGLELGINGSSGSSEAFSIRAGGYIKRESRFSKLDLSAYHNRTTTGGESTQNNAQFDVRNDWLLDEKSPWTLYATSNVFYDEFQAFDVQTNANTGIGYRFVHDDDLGLIARVGAGASREIGGPDDRWVPESLFGFEYNQQLATNQKLTAKLDYFPEWDQIGEYRLVADAGWEIELLQPSNMSLKISASDRFDSTPNGAEPNLVNYSVLLLLKL